jgi:hypothetical protein
MVPISSCQHFGPVLAPYQESYAAVGVLPLGFDEATNSVQVLLGHGIEGLTTAKDVELWGLGCRQWGYLSLDRHPELDTSIFATARRALTYHTRGLLSLPELDQCRFPQYAFWLPTSSFLLLMARHPVLNNASFRPEFRQAPLPAAPSVHREPTTTRRGQEHHHPKEDLVWMPLLQLLDIAKSAARKKQVLFSAQPVSRYLLSYLRHHSVLPLLESVASIRTSIAFEMAWQESTSLLARPSWKRADVVAAAAATRMPVDLFSSPPPPTSPSEPLTTAPPPAVAAKPLNTVAPATVPLKTAPAAPATVRTPTQQESKQQGMYWWRRDTTPQAFSSFYWRWTSRGLESTLNNIRSPWSRPHA